MSQPEPVLLGWAWLMLRMGLSWMNRTGFFRCAHSEGQGPTQLFWSSSLVEVEKINIQNISGLSNRTGLSRCAYSEGQGPTELVWSSSLAEVEKNKYAKYFWFVQ